MNPPSAVLGGGVHGKVCWLIGYICLLSEMSLHKARTNQTIKKLYYENIILLIVIVCEINSKHFKSITIKYIFSTSIDIYLNLL